ncbi:MAG: putative toxin-antitoxin system toxin component, PIN family [Paracoccaceae bacterium]
MRAIFDTNLFVGAGFNPRSASARLIKAAREGRLEMVWNKATQDETRRVLTKIPRISWEAVEGIFLPAHEALVVEDLSHVGFVTDPGDRKYAALSLATGTPVVTSDDDLLCHADRLNVVKPRVFCEQFDLRRD